MTTADPLADLHHQAAALLARARADDHGPSLTDRVAAALNPDQPIPLDHWIAGQVWVFRGHRRGWVDLGSLARRRWLLEAMPYRRALLAAVPHLTGLGRPS